MGGSLGEWKIVRLPWRTLDCPRRNQRTIYLDRAISFLSSLIDYFVADVNRANESRANESKGES
jgi:hypothetical protein